MSNELPAIPFSDIERMGRAVALSKLFGLQTPEQAVALMLIAQAEGLHPAIAARDYHIIQGRPALKADAMLSRFQAAGGKVQWTELTDKRVAAIFAHPQGGSVEIDWTMERAKTAELGGKDMWKKYPRQMLRARVISEGIRTVYPGCLVGFYTPEEVVDMEPIEPLKVAEPEPVVESLPPAKEPPKESVPKTDKISDAQRRRFYAICKSGGWSDDAIKAYLKNVIGVESSHDIPSDRYEEACKWGKNDANDSV